MKQEEFNNIMNTIRTDETIKNNIWKNINNEKKSEKKKPVRIYWAATIIVLCIFSFSMPLIASGVQSLILEKYPEYNFLSNEIETAIYSDSDGHVVMTVEEMLSDEQVVYITVKYEALDREGREWLAEDSFYGIGRTDSSFDPNPKGFYIIPYMVPDQNWGYHRVNYSVGCQELAELRTQTERWFSLSFHASSRNYASGQGDFVYPLTNGVFVRTLLDVANNVEVSAYELEDAISSSPYYQPTYIQLSVLSYTIYGLQNGIYYEEIGENYVREFILLPRETIHSLHDSIYFVMSDGSKIPAEKGASGGCTPSSENGYSDYIIQSSLLPSNGATIISPDNIVGVEIDDVYYEIIK